MSTSTTEQEAHDAVLAWCRRQDHVGMREAPPNPIPGYERPTRYRVCHLGWVDRDPIAEGDTWAEILAKLTDNGDRR